MVRVLNPPGIVSEASTISQLEAIIAQLPPEEQRIVQQIYSVRNEHPKMRILPTMDVSKMGTPSELESQLVVKVTNRVTGRIAAYNGMRARRPMPSADPDDPILQRLLNQPNCPLCEPEKLTPEEPPFGRIRDGNYSVTAANIAPYGEACGLVIFHRHNPLEVTEKELHDGFDTSYKWLLAQQATYPHSSCPWLIWNVLPRAASSLIHTHFQVGLEEGGSLPEVEDLKAKNNLYALKHGGNFFDDLITAHEALGLGFQLQDGTAVLAELTPIKEKGVMIVRKESWHDFANLSHAVYVALQALLATGTQSFNMVTYLPSLKLDFGWDMLPAVVRFIDRGPLSAMNSDIGGVEFLGKSVISSDPYAVMRHLVKTYAQLSRGPEGNGHLH